MREVSLADALYRHLRWGADLMRAFCPGGLTPEAEEWVERSHSMVMAQEITASLSALGRAIQEGEVDDEDGVDVTDAFLRLAMQHVERYGPLLRLVGAA